MDFLTKPWPWYIAGPLIGIFVPLLLLIGNKAFGISSNFRHVCAMCVPGKIPYFNYNWKKEGTWQLLMVLGVILGASLATLTGETTYSIALSANTIQAIKEMGISDLQGLIPTELFSFQTIFTLKGIVLMVIGGFLVGFGTRYANGCTSGHTITGISNLQLGSVIASIGFFIGGLITVHLIYPILF